MIPLQPFLELAAYSKEKPEQYMLSMASPLISKQVKLLPWLVNLAVERRQLREFYWGLISRAQDQLKFWVEIWDH
jgi:hypothetical protein